MVRIYFWLNFFNVLLRLFGEQPCVRLRGGQCFSPQKIPRGGSFVVTLLEGNLLLFGGLFENTYRDGFYTLGRCTNLAAKQS